MNAIFTTDDRINLFDAVAARRAKIEALYEECGDAETQGRLAFHQGDADNPYWEGGLRRAWQGCAAIEWLDGWETEFDFAAKHGVRC